MGALGGKGSGLVERIIDYMAPEDLEPEDDAREAGKVKPKRSHKESADLATRLAMNPALSMALLIGQPGFAKGVTDPLPDNAVPDFAKGAQGALAAKPGGWRDRVADRIEAEPREGEAFAQMLTAPFSGALRDPVRTASELSGYAPLSRAHDAFTDMDSPDVAYNAGRFVRGSGEGALGAATVAGNIYGAGQAARGAGGALARVYRGGAAAELPAADSVGALRGRLAKAESAGPDQLQSMIDEAGARAAAAESRINPVDYSGAEAAPPSAPVAAPKDWTVNIEGRTAPRGALGKRQPRPEPDAYTPLEMTPEEQAAIDLSRANQGRTGMWDQPSLSPDGPRGPGALTPLSAEQKAAMNAEIERLAWAADDADKAGNPGAVAQAHEDIASIMARTGKPLETSPRLQAIQDRIDAIDRELKTADGAWREEELLAEAEALMNERRTLRGKAPRQGALGDSTTLGMSGGNLWDDSGTSVADSIGNFVRKLRKSPAGDQEPTFRASEPNLTFGGQRAATADTGALAKAQELDAAGAPREQIWSETGWFKGVDGKWRFEIDDSQSGLRPLANAELIAGGDHGATQRTFAGVMDHKKLLDAYPDLRRIDIDARFNKGLSQPNGAFTPSPAGNGGRSQIDVSTNSIGGPNGVRGIALHESQHAIQDLEGFATGGSPVVGQKIADVERLAKQAYEEAGDLTDDQIFWELSGGEGPRPQSPTNRPAWEDLPRRKQLEWFQTGRERAYRLGAGETEARNVQTRFDWTPEQRRETPPWMSQDVPDDQQIVSFSNGVSSSDNPTILGSNGGNLGAEGRVRRPKSTLPTDPQIRQERLQGIRGQEPFYDDRLNAMQNKVVEMARNRYTDAEIADELELAPQTVQVYRMNARDLGIDVPQHRALSAQDDVLRLAQKGLTNQQIAERLGKNPNNVKQQIFKLRRAGLLPSPSNPARTIAGAGLIAGTTYLPARLAADFAADQQEEGALPAWMVEQAPPHNRGGALSR